MLSSPHCNTPTLIVRLRNALHKAGGVLMVTALAGKEPVAAALLFIHGQAATYQVGWSNAAGRTSSAMRLVLWRAIEESRQTGDFQASPGVVCRWCSFKALCPAYGGTPPPFPPPWPRPEGPPSARPPAGASAMIRICSRRTSRGGSSWWKRK